MFKEVLTSSPGMRASAVEVETDTSPPVDASSPVVKPDRLWSRLCSTAAKARAEDAVAGAWATTVSSEKSSAILRVTSLRLAIQCSVSPGSGISPECRSSPTR